MPTPSTVRPVALLTPRFPPDAGGMSLAVARLARQLSERMPVEVIVMGQGSTPGVDVDSDSGWLVIRVEAPSAEQAQQLTFDVLRERGNYRLVHAVYPSRTGFVAAMAANVLSIPLLLAARGNDLLRDAFRPDRQPALLWAMQRADAVVGVSRQLRDTATALGAKHSVWIPNGVDTERFTPQPRDPDLRRALGLDETFPIVGFCGEARSKKGLDTLLGALSLLRRRRGDVRLLLIGDVRDDAQGPCQQRLDAMPELAPHVITTGWLQQDDVPPYLAQLDCLWHPATSEGLPNALLEAMACAVPVVSSRTGGCWDIVEESPWEPYTVTSLAPVDAARQLAESTLRLLQIDAAERLEMGQAGRRWVAQRFTPEREVQAYLNLYASLTGDTPSAP